jgi:hypothetical protein
MGSFFGNLGHVAQGYTDASQKEMTRQFEVERDRRSQIVDMLGKLAQDESAHPDTRNSALQMAIDTLHSPWNKPVKPDFGRLITTAPGRKLSEFTPPPTPPLEIGGQTVPNEQPRTVSLESPPSPPGLRYTPEEQAQMAARAVGAVTGARAGAEAKFPIIRQNPETGEYEQVFASGTGQPMGGQFENVTPSGMLRSNAIHPVAVEGPDGVPIPALQNKITKEVYDQDGNIIPNARIFAPSLVGHTSSTTDPTGLVTSTKRTAQPRAGAGRAATPSRLSEPPAPPSLESLGGSATPAELKTPVAAPASTKPAPRAAKSQTQPTAAGQQPSREVKRVFDNLKLTPQARENVSAEMDRMLNEGIKPDEKFSKLRQIAYTALQRQGITPPLQGTEATRTMADKGRIALGLISDARRLIAANPDALGPLSGSWSKLQQKFGTLEGAPKELAGVLISLYSVAGGLHGWRAMGVADQFQNTFGGIGSTPGSLEAGLSGMEKMANHAIKVGYPGRAGEQMTGGGGQASQQFIYARDRDGKLHKAPVGSTLPTGWKEEKAPQ